jgi:hypothetical protein
LRDFATIVTRPPLRDSETSTGFGIAALHRLGADQVVLAANDHLRRVDRAFSRGAGIGALTFGERGVGEFVLPADVVPVIHMQSQRDHVVALCDLAQNAVGGRAGRTSLRGEQLDHHRPVGMRHGCNGCPKCHGPDCDSRHDVPVQMSIPCSD